MKYLCFQQKAVFFTSSASIADAGALPWRALLPLRSEEVQVIRGTGPPTVRLMKLIGRQYLIVTRRLASSLPSFKSINLDCVRLAHMNYCDDLRQHMSLS